MNLSRNEYNQFVSNVMTENILNHNLYIQFNDCVIKVISNSDSVINQLRNYFDEFEVKEQNISLEITAIESKNLNLDINFIDKPCDPGKSKIKEQFFDIEEKCRIIRKKITGLYFFTDEHTNLAIGECEKNINQVINFVNNRFMQYVLNHKGVLLHAAAVNYKNQGIAMSGFSGKGKSTLSLFFMNEGAMFISNDRLMAFRDEQITTMLGVLKHPRVNPGTLVSNPKLKHLVSDQKLTEYLSMPVSDLWTLEEKYDVLIHETYGKQMFHIDSKLDAYIILNWDLNSTIPTQINQIDLRHRTDLLSACMKPAGLFYLYDQSKWFNQKMYLETLSSVKTFEVSGKIDFQKVIDYF